MAGRGKSRRASGSWQGHRGSHPGRCRVCQGLLLPFSAILDLAYCLEAEAMVTASRDSTVKVWEADWRIRMVFMGHTGAPCHCRPRGPLSLRPVHGPRERALGSGQASLHWLHPGLTAPLPQPPREPE